VVLDPLPCRTVARGALGCPEGFSLFEVLSIGKVAQREGDE